MLLIERDHVIEHLETSVRRAPRGGRSVFLVGRPGEGKTTVLRSVAGAASIPVWWGTCDALTTPRPLGPLHDVASSEPIVEQILTGTASRFEIFASVLERLTKQSILMVIEDVHWSDDATADLLLYLGRRIDRTRSVLVASFRPDEIHPHTQIERALGDLATAPNHSEVLLDPLSPEGVRLLADGHALDPKRLHAMTGGNAFFVTEVLASPGWTVPPSVSAAVLARAARLSPSQRDVLDLVSVEPGPCEQEILVEAGCEAADIGTVISSGILTAAERRVVFRHELGRLAILDAMDPLGRASRHATMLAAIRKRHRPNPARLVHHAIGCGDNEAILESAKVAGDSAAKSGAHREAEIHFRHAIDAWDRTAPEDSHDESPLLALLDGHASALAAIDRQTEVVADRERMVEIALRSGDHISAAIAHTDLARALWRKGDGDLSRNLIRQTVVDAESTADPRAIAHAHASAGYIAMLSRHRHDAIRHSRRSIELAEQHRFEEILASALNSLGSTRLAMFDDAGGRDDLERAAAIAATIGADSSVSNVYVNIGSGLGEIRRYADAEHHLRRSIEFAAERDLDAHAIYAEAWLAKVFYETGRWDEGLELARKVIDMAQPDSPIAPIMALTASAGILTRRGDDAGADLARAWSLATATNDLQRLWPVLAVRAEAAWLADESDEQLRQDLGRVLATAVEHEVAWGIGEVGIWAKRLGVIDHVPSGAAEPYRLSSEGAHAAAAAAWNAIGCPYEHAWALTETGDEKHMLAGLSILNDLGGRPLGNRVRASLRDLGVTKVPLGRRTATAAHPGGLTPRQDEVLAQLVSGHTDREIADALYLSTKTVGHHVSAILRRLGVETRTEAALRAVQEGWHRQS